MTQEDTEGQVRQPEGIKEEMKIQSEMGFTMVPYHILHAEGVNSTEALFWGLVKSFTRMKSGRCYASNDLLARMMNVTPRHIRRLISNLCEAGFMINKEDQKGRTGRILIPLDAFDKPRSEWFTREIIGRNDEIYGEEGEDTEVRGGEKDVTPHGTECPEGRTRRSGREDKEVHLLKNKSEEREKKTPCGRGQEALFTLPKSSSSKKKRGIWDLAVIESGISGAQLEEYRRLINHHRKWGEPLSMAFIAEEMRRAAKLRVTDLKKIVDLSIEKGWRSLNAGLERIGIDPEDPELKPRGAQDKPEGGRGPLSIRERVGQLSEDDRRILEDVYVPYVEKKMGNGMPDDEVLEIALGGFLQEKAKREGGEV